MRVDIYSKADCSLCEALKEVVLAVREEVPFVLVETDIRASPELFQRHRYDIPVLLVNGQVAFKHRVTAEELRARLLQERGT